MSAQVNRQSYNKQHSGIFNPNEYIAQLRSEGMFEHVTEGCQCVGKRCTKARNQANYRSRRAHLQGRYEFNRKHSTSLSFLQRK